MAPKKNRLSPIPQPPTKPVVGNMLSLDSAGGLVSYWPLEINVP